MRTIILTAAAALVGCTSTPYDDLAYQVKHDVRWVSQSGEGHVDRMVFGCRPEGDCDDRALCAACRLVQSGVKGSEITVVVQGWPGSSPKNHMSLEYKGYCLLGYGSTAYEGTCEHIWEDSKMFTTRMTLPDYIRRKKTFMECEGFNNGF